MSPNEIYEPVANDNISRGFEATKIVPATLRGTDEFLDIVTWNLRYFHHFDHARVEKISEILSVLNADIIVLQEVLDNSLDLVVQRLAELGAGYYQVSYGTTGGNQRIAIMWDLDWIRAKDDVCELVRKKEVMAPDNKDAFPRAPLWGYFTSISEPDGADPFDFQLVGVHLKSQRGGGAMQRKVSGDWLAKWLKGDAQAVDADVIIIGDWNEKPSSDSWSGMHELEKQNTAKFRSINNESKISHFYYKNKSTLGSRLDLAAVSIAAYDEVVGDPKVVRWTSLDDFLDTQPKAKEIKSYLKQIRKNISDHMPVITRFYFQEQP